MQIPESAGGSTSPPVVKGGHNYKWMLLTKEMNSRVLRRKNNNSDSSHQLEYQRANKGGLDMGAKVTMKWAKSSTDNSILKIGRFRFNLWSLITKHEFFKFKKITIFPYTSSFDPESSPSLKKHIFWCISHFGFDRFAKNGSFWYIISHIETC